MSSQPIFNAFTTRPKTANRKSKIGAHALVRDQLSITSWLLVGAVIQGIAHVLLPYRNILIVLPVILFIVYKMCNTFLMVWGIVPNPRLNKSLPYRTTVVYPDSNGNQDKPGSEPVCAMLLGVVSHHPLGAFGPGFKDVGAKFEAMITELSNDASKHGFLGASSWLNAHERTTSNEYASILYFDNEESLYEYAHGPLHSEIMQWWRKEGENLKHIGIMHEVFACPKNGWEGVYLNYHPTGLGQTTKAVVGADGKKVWVSPLVRGKGKLAYSKGRMGRSFGDKEWEAFGATLGAADEV